MNMPSNEQYNQYAEGEQVIMQREEMQSTQSSDAQSIIFAARRMADRISGLEAQVLRLEKENYELREEANRGHVTAWEAVVRVIKKYDPRWYTLGKSGIESAVKSLEDAYKKRKKYDAQETIDESTRQQASAWQKVVRALEKYDPYFLVGEGSGTQRTVALIERFIERDKKLSELEKLVGGE